jgi:murein DD-endopeptidase MepM/ murein hydrolase activator NlpD
MAANSPADRVPSHGTHANAQTFAIDLYDPDCNALPGRKDRAFRRPEEFGGFGREILAPAAGRVVLVRDGARDHRSRSTTKAVSFMRLEGFLRQALGGARLLAGNIIVLDLGDGVYIALAHLKRRSATVKPGQQVRQGELLGRCGNSGNSSQPHLHFQLMDHPRQSLAAGLPFTFTATNDGSPPAPGHVPHSGETIEARPTTLRAVAPVT